MMKKTAILISMILCYIHSFADYSGTVTTSLSDLSFSGKNGYHIISLLDEQYTEEIGAPQLPVKMLSFLIPIDKRINNIIINSSTVQQLSGSYNIYPVQTPTIVPNSLPFDNPTPTIYSSSNSYPGIKYSITEDGYPMGYHVVTITFYPIEYIPANHIINLYTSINFTIEYANNTDEVLRPNRQSIYSNNLSKASVQSLVVNPSAISSVGGGAKQIVGNGSPTSGLRGMNPTEIINIPDYIIITSNSLAGNSTTGFQKLADWKIQKGVNTLVVTIEDIFSNYQGIDGAEKIRNYLKDVFLNFGSVFILLGGDVKDENGVDLIPARSVQIGMGAPDDFKETDYYYATVEGNWNPNGNNIFGEASELPVSSSQWSPVFLIGRAPVHNLAEASNFANKIINYENLKGNNNQPLSNLNYVNNLSFFANDCNTCGNNGFKSVLSDALNNMQTSLLPSPEYSVTKLYSTAPILDHNTAMAVLNATNSPHHIIYHLDHSGFDNMSTGSGWGGGGINTGDMDALTNGSYYSIFYTDGCHPNDFANNSVSKHFINNPNGGGVAFIGNTSSGFGSDYSHFTTRFMNALYSNTKLSGLQNYDNSNYHIGYLNRWASPSVKYKKNRNLLGDPEMMVWTKNPQNLTVTKNYSLTNHEITGTVSGFTFSSTSTIIVTVTAWKGEEIWATTNIAATTASTGFTLSNIFANTPGNITLTVTAHNYIPNISSINVASPISGAHPYKSNNQILDDNTLGSIGNGNNYPDAGEKIALPITITNSGNATASNVTATLSWTADSYQTQSGGNATIAIDNSSSTFGDVPSGGTANNNSNVFIFTVNKDAFDGITPRPLMQYINFTLDILIGGTLFSSKSFAIQIGEPNLIKGENSVNGTLLAGSSNQLNIKLYNYGISEAVDLTATLSTNNSSNITMINVNSLYDNISTAISTNFGSNLTTFSFDIVGNNYSNETFNLSVTNSYGKTWNFNDFHLIKPVANIIVNASGQLTSIYHSWTCTLTSPAGDLIKGYNIFRSPAGSGTYTKLNANLLPYATYTDKSLQQFTLYDYKLTVVDVNGNESAPYFYSASTSLDAHGGWPIVAEKNVLPIIGWAEGSPNVYDLNGDGTKEIFFTTGVGSTKTTGGVWAFHEDASRWYSYDGNITNKSGYINYNCYSMATPAIADIDNDGIAELGITTGWDGNSSSGNSTKLFVYDVIDASSTPPANQGNFPIQTSNWEMMKGAIFTDIDNDAQLEVIANNFTGGSILVANSDGTPHTWANTNSHNFGWSMPVAFDFNNDGKKEIIIGSSGTDLNGTNAGIYIFNEDGTDYNTTNPIYVPSTGFRTDFMPIILDIDNDKANEILFISAKNTTANILAMRPDGTLLNGWGSGGQPSFTLKKSVKTNSSADLYDGQFCPGFSVADLDKDGDPEIVSGDNGHLYVWNNTGGATPLLDMGISGYISSTFKVPILADIDEDPSDLEIIVTGVAASPLTGTNIYAFKLNGTSVVGFPMYISEGVGNSPCVDDIDNNGKNELIITTGSKFYVWDSPGDATNNEYGWNSYRHDSRNTGVYPSFNDLFIKDIPEDDGTVPLAGYNSWNLVDGNGVWVRQAPATLTSTNPNHYTFENQHQDVEYRLGWPTDPNTRPRVYVKVHNRGGNTITGNVRIYYHKLSTNDKWNDYNSATNSYGSWEEILCGDTDGDGYINNGEVLCGDSDENGSIDNGEISPNTITLAPGQDGVIEQIWNNVAQTNVFTNPNTGSRKEWCLLARLESTQDPIINEQVNISAGNNAQMSNNITQKNVTFIEDIVGNIVKPVDFGNVSEIATTNEIRMVDGSSPFTGLNGEVTIDLGQPLYDAWVQGGRKGSGITDGKNKYNHMSPTGAIHNHSHLILDSKPYQLKLTSGTASLENINLAPFEIYPVNVEFKYFAGAGSETPFEYYLVQQESINGIQNYAGAVKYYIKKPDCPTVSTSPDVTIGRLCSTTLTASSISGATYTWRDNNKGTIVGTGSIIEVSPHNTTSYEVEIEMPNNCIDYDVVTVTVSSVGSCQPNCGPSEFNNKILNENTIIDARETVISNTLRVPNNITLTISESTLNFKEDAKIEVMPGGKLEIINSKLRSCESLKKWKGIIVKGNNSDPEQLRIKHSEIIDARIPIEMEKVVNARITENIFDNGLTAIKIEKGKNFNISKNEFYNYDVAVLSTNGILDEQSFISENSFTNERMAIKLENGNHSNLDMKCNIFDTYSEYAIHSNNSTLKDQGTNVEGAGNVFISGSVKQNDKLHHNGNSMKYYYDPSTPVLLVTGTGMTATAETAMQDGSCSVNPLRGSISDGTEISNLENPATNNLSVYGTDNYLKLLNCIPNPASDKVLFTYSLLQNKYGEIRIMNLLGEVIDKYPVASGTNSVVADCSTLQNGIYFYSLIIDNKILTTKKMVITK